jgi:hypothetical protein
MRKRKSRFQHGRSLRSALFLTLPALALVVQFSGSQGTMFRIGQTAYGAEIETGSDSPSNTGGQTGVGTPTSAANTTGTDNPSSATASSGTDGTDSQTAATPSSSSGGGAPQAPLPSVPFPRNQGVEGLVLQTQQLSSTLGSVQASTGVTAAGTTSLASVEFSGLTMNGFSLYKNFQVGGTPFVMHMKSGTNDTVTEGEGRLLLSDFYAGTLSVPDANEGTAQIQNFWQQPPQLVTSLSPLQGANISANQVKINAHSLSVSQLHISHFELSIEPGNLTTTVQP